ncbi:hypothetical protein, partial [Spiribacter roseus]|uniref:hypothetical protein n=1 Tax=Spiribacter roseus TaxID=1855875 RepID=UPI001F44187C
KHTHIYISIFVFILIALFLEHLTWFAQQTGTTSKAALNRIAFHHIFVNYLLAICVSYFMLRGNNVAVVGLLFLALLFTILTKSRSPIAFSLLMVIFIFWNRNNVSRITKFRALGVGSIGIISIVLIDQFLGSILQGRFNDILSQLISIDTYTNALYRIQSNINLAIAHHVIVDDLRYPSEAFWHGLLGLLPLGESVLDITITKWPVWVHTKIAPSLPYGIAGNVYAQMYSLGGWLAILIFCFLWTLTNYLLFMLINTKAPIIKLAALGATPYLSFFFIRQDLWATLSVVISGVSFVLFVAIVSWMISQLLTTSCRAYDNASY